MKEALETWNVIYLDAPLEEIWWATVHPDGVNAWLSDTASFTGDPKNPKPGDVYSFVYGSISNESKIVEIEPLSRLVLDDTYVSRFPNGNSITYLLRTTYEITSTADGFRYTVHTKGYHDDVTGHWLINCMHMGWRKSLYNLKGVLEHGMDLRYQIFGYPRIGIHNMSVRPFQFEEAGTASGNYLLRVFPNTPAAESGLQAGDVILAVGTTPTPIYHDLVRALGKHQAANVVPIRYLRAGQVYETECRLTDDPVLAGFVDPPTSAD